MEKQDLNYAQTTVIITYMQCLHKYLFDVQYKFNMHVRSYYNGMYVCIYVCIVSLYVCVYIHS